MALWDEPTEIDDDTVFGKRLNDKALQKMPDATGGSMTLLNPRYGLLNARNRGGVRPTLPNRDPENDRPGPDDRLLPSDFIPDVDEERNRFSPYQPVAPFGPPSIVDAREWDYPTGYNLEIVNRHIVLGEMLRGIVRGSGIIANELSARVDELVSLPWKFILKNPAKGVKSEDDPRIKELNAFFKMPDRKIPYPQWMEMIFRERYTIDAATVYIWKNRAGTKPYALEVIDGNTIVPKIDDRGRVPDWPSLAYVQIVKGLPMDNFTEREIVYMPRHRWAQMPIFGYCYDSETEILTKNRGFVKFSDLKPSEEVATRSLSGEFQWQIPIAKIDTPYSGKMLHFTSRSMDVMVTPEHRMLVSMCKLRSKERSEKVMLARDMAKGLNHERKIPVTSHWSGVEVGEQVFSRRGCPTLRISGDDYCALMGAYIAEGNLRSQGGIEVAQRPESKGWKEYKALFDRIGGHTGKRTFTLARRTITEHFRKFGHAHEKYVPELIKNATSRQIEIFLRYYGLGDGSFDPKPNISGRGDQPKFGVRYTTVSKMLADGIVELVQKTGNSAAVGIAQEAQDQEFHIEGKSYMSSCRTAYAVTVRYSKQMAVKAREIDYEGNIYCVTVPNGIVYVRRNGKPCWSGNSEVEQILMEATQQVRKTMYMLNFWAEGTCPDVMVCCPENWCYSDDTEVLTQDGWKRFTNVDIEVDKFATRKPVTKEFQWQKATGINLQPYSGEMVHLQSRSIDCLVNPPHRVLLSKRNGKERIVLAKELLESHIDGDRIPIVSNWNEGKEIKTRVFSQTTNRGGGFTLEMTGDQYCAFMGAWLAEGYTSCSGRVAGIAQVVDGKGFNAYWELVNNIKGASPSHNWKSITVCNAPLGRYLSKFGHASEKYVPAEIMNATPRQIEIFLRYYALGDGSKTAPVIYTSSRKMADQLQELVQKTGKSATIAEDDRRGRKLKFEGNREGNTNHVSYIVSMSDSKMRRFSVASEQYSGMIGCVSVPNGILYVRRNGKACWSGNTAEQIALWQGTFDALMSGNLKLKSKMRFIPGGGKPFEMKGSAGDLLKSEYDEWMARIVCRAFRTDPKPYIKEPEPRANSEQLQEQMRAQGLNGEMLWWSSLMERLIFLGWGWDDIGHAFDQNEEVAATDQATIDIANTSLGARTINELRDRDGLDAVEGGDVPMVKTGTGWMPLAVLAAQTALPTPVAPGGTGGASGPGKNASKPTPTQKEAGTEADRPLAKQGSHWSRY
jgi:hypothetical protein